MNIALPLICFGALVLAALASIWRQPSLRVVGFALVGGFIASNLAWTYAPMSHRPGIFTMTEVVLVVAAFAAWLDCRLRSLIALSTVAVMSICANIGFAINPTADRLYAYELITNILFVAECLIVIWIGVADRVRVGHLNSRASDCGPDSQPHVARSEP